LTDPFYGEVPPPPAGAPRPPAWDLTQRAAIPPDKVIGRRVAAGFIDLIPLAFVWVGFSEREDSANGVMYRVEGMNLLVVLAVVLGYYFVSEALTGTTVGKWLLNLHVVNDMGNRPSTGQIAGRTGLRVIDALPVLYLVGFIAMLASPRDHRLGDMAAHTYVQRRLKGRSPAAAGVLVVVAAAAIAIGLFGAATGDDDEVSNDQVGAYDYTTDVVPMVDTVMRDGFGDSSAENLLALMPSGEVNLEEISSLLEQLADGGGDWSGEYEITSHDVVPDAVVQGFGNYDLMVVDIDSAYENGPVHVQLVFADVADQLRLLRFDVTPT